jgi:hypothetical protein
VVFDDLRKERYNKSLLEDMFYESFHLFTPYPPSLYLYLYLYLYIYLYHYCYCYCYSLS